jgi:predicted MFS family arabinose efflux permease
MAAMKDDPYRPPQADLDSPDRNSSARVGQTFLYFGSLTFFLYLAAPTQFLVDIPTSYLLKNQFHFEPTQVSMFRLLVGIPVYFAFAFGLIRDLWNPLGMRDRGYFLIFAPLTALTFVWLALTQLSYAGLLIGILAAMLLSRFVAAAYQGLMALVGQERLMSGRLSALWNVVSYIPIVIGGLLSGYISDHLPPNATFFFLAAAFTGCIAVLGIWKPRSVFSETYNRPQAKGAGLIGDIRRLLRHRAIYAAVLINFMWNFAPGSATPLQFYLTNKLGATDAVYSYFNAIFSAAFIPMFLLYGLLCKKVALNKLLWWGTIIAVPQMVPLLFVQSPSLALWLAAPIGAMGGIATAAYIDLAMRSCPPGLQGTLMMMVDGVLLLSSRGGDYLGSAIYESSPTHGFLYCVIAITTVYALILPLILLVPKKLIATADGEPNPDVEAELRDEIAATS